MVWLNLYECGHIGLAELEIVRKITNGVFPPLLSLFSPLALSVCRSPCIVHPQGGTEITFYEMDKDQIGLYCNCGRVKSRGQKHLQLLCYFAS